MNGRALTITPAVLGPIGLALLVFESVQTLRSVVLGTRGMTVLFVGIGLVVIAGTLAVVAVSGSVGSTSTASVDPTVTFAADRVAVAATPAETQQDGNAEVAAGWTLLCRTDGAGRIATGADETSVRRGATLIAYEEGVLIGVGKTQQHLAWPDVTGIDAMLSGGQARIKVQFGGDAGTTEATFTGKTGDLAPVATALVSAAPEGRVSVKYA
jgi:hypothetical protein